MVGAVIRLRDYNRCGIRDIHYTVYMVLNPRTKNGTYMLRIEYILDIVNEQSLGLVSK